MFEIGDRVRVDGKVGQIVCWHFDEGDVWHVVIDGHMHECYNEQMVLA